MKVIIRALILLVVLILIQVLEKNVEAITVEYMILGYLIWWKLEDLDKEKQMISKKLLEQAIGDEYRDRLVDWMQIEDNYLCTYYDCGKYDLQGRPTGLGIEINVYELAYKCKEFLRKRYGLTVTTGRFNVNFYTAVVYIEGREVDDYQGTTELDAIEKVYKWIMESIKEKQNDNN